MFGGEGSAVGTGLEPGTAGFVVHAAVALLCTMFALPTAAVGLEYSGLIFGKATPDDVKNVAGEFQGCVTDSVAPPNEKADAKQWATNAITRCTVIINKGSDGRPSTIRQEFVFQRGVLQAVRLIANDDATYENLNREVSKEYAGNREAERALTTTSLQRRILISNQPFRVGPGVDPPKLIRRFEPAYPEEVRRARLEGVVIIEAVISAAGSVEGPKLLKSPAPKLSELALHAVSQWKYRPAAFEGDPVPVYLTVTTTFSLR